MPSGKPRLHRGQATQRHVLAVQQQNRDLQKRTLEGWRELTSGDGIPQLEELRQACVALLEAAVPLKGRNLDTSRGGGDFISSDGRSTVDGRATMSYRDRCAFVGRQLEYVLRNIASLHEGGRRSAGRPPQTCLACGRKQSAFNNFCLQCGTSLKAA